MTKNDVKLRLNKTIWEKASTKTRYLFGSKLKIVDMVLIIMLLALYKWKRNEHSTKDKYEVLTHPSENSKDNYICKTVCVYTDLFELMQKNPYNKLTYSELFECAMVDFIEKDISFYTSQISPLYTIVGSKNFTMQKATSDAVAAMNLDTANIELVDACCATGSLYFGLQHFEWKKVTLNDLNPLRTNFLTVIQKKPLELIRLLLDMDLSFVKTPNLKNSNLRIYKQHTDEYAAKRRNYHKVSCNVEIAFETFLQQCLDKAIIESPEKIFQRILRFLPAHLKLQNATITQKDCLTYLKNDTADKLVLLDVPYIGSESTCGIKKYNYEPFHEKVADLLQQADYPFVYYCRSSAPKSDKTRPLEKKVHMMQMKLGDYFFNKGYYFQKVQLKEDTELMISNQQYDDEKQFEWTDFSQNIL